jgi:hypothetical protein
VTWDFEEWTWNQLTTWLEASFKCKISLMTLILKLDVIILSWPCTCCGKCPCKLPWLIQPWWNPVNSPLQTLSSKATHDMSSWRSLRSLSRQFNTISLADHGATEHEHIVKSMKGTVCPTQLARKWCSDHWLAVGYCDKNSLLHLRARG